DLRRWLRGEPIRARRVSAARRLALWCRRQPGPAALTAAVLALFLAVTAVSLWAAREGSARAEVSLARQREQQRETVMQRLAALVRAREPHPGWPDPAWQPIDGARALGKDARLRDLAAGVLVELDARLAGRFAGPTSAVAFPRDGRLLLGPANEHEPV